MWLKSISNQFHGMPINGNIYTKERLSLAVYSWTIPNQRNIRQIDRNCHLEFLTIRTVRLSTWSSPNMQWRAPSRQGGSNIVDGDFKNSSDDKSWNYISFGVFLTLLALRGLCLQACYQCLVDSSFYIPRLPSLLNSFYNFILFLAFPPHPMPSPFFPIGFCPVEPVDRLYPISRSDFHL